MEIRLVNAYSLASKICVFTDAMVVLSNEPEITLNTLRDVIYQDAVEHGLWDDFRKSMCAYEELPDYARMQAVRHYITAVIAGELGELRDASADAEHYAEELADVIISSLSVAGYLGIDIDTALKRKMEINKGRSYKHENE